MVRQQRHTKEKPYKIKAGELGIRQQPLGKWKFLEIKRPPIAEGFDSFLMKKGAIIWLG